jgi:hypothetical protein
MATPQRDLRSHIREEPALARSVLVVRGGPIDLDKLRHHAERTHRTFLLDGQAVWGVSVFCALDASGASSLDAVLSDLLRSYRSVHLPRVGDLLDAGFELLPTFGRPHYTLRLAGVTDTELSRLVGALGTGQPNPYYGQAGPRR